MSLSQSAELEQARSHVNVAYAEGEFKRRRAILNAPNLSRDAYVAPYPALDAECFGIKQGDALWKWKNSGNSSSGKGYPEVWAVFNDIVAHRQKLNGRTEPEDEAKFWNWLNKSITLIGFAVSDYAFDPSAERGGGAGALAAVRGGTIRVINTGPNAITAGSLVMVRPPRRFEPRLTDYAGYARHRMMGEFVPWDASELFETRDGIRRYWRVDSAKAVNESAKTRYAADQERRNYPDETAERLAEFVKICAFFGVHVLKAHFAQRGNPGVALDTIGSDLLEKVFGLAPMTVEERERDTYVVSNPAALNILGNRAWKSVGTDTALLALATGVSNTDTVGGQVSIGTRRIQQGALTLFLTAWQDRTLEIANRVVGTANNYADEGEPFTLHVHTAGF